MKKGETLEDITKKFDVDAAALKKENNLSKEKITPGQRLRIPPPVAGSFLPPNHQTDMADKGKVRTPKVKTILPPVAAPRIPQTLSWPVEGSIISPFGIRKNGKHDGIDIASREGTKIVAAADGTVIFSGWGPNGYGNIVVIKHAENLVTVYAHNSKNIVELGAQVKKGEGIALVGHTGRASTSHCHFEVRISRVAYDPLEYLPKK